MRNARDAVELSSKVKDRALMRTLEQNWQPISHRGGRKEKITPIKRRPQ